MALFRCGSNMEQFNKIEWTLDSDIDSGTYTATSKVFTDFDAIMAIQVADRYTNIQSAMVLTLQGYRNGTWVDIKTVTDNSSLTFRCISIIYTKEQKYSSFRFVYQSASSQYGCRGSIYTYKKGN